MPDHYPQTIEGVKAFLLDVIAATQDFCIAYKPNISFFEALGIEGLRVLESVRKAIPESIPMILDGKRGDIGNTSAKQAKYLFDVFGADASTLHPYMGADSLVPFFEYKDKFHFVLGLTSNSGAKDFEFALTDGVPLYSKIIQRCDQWLVEYGNVGVVVGGTQSELKTIRVANPKLLFLIPGVGAQGGDYQDCALTGRNADGLALINVGRSLIYASKAPDFLDKVRLLAQTNYGLVR